MGFLGGSAGKESACNEEDLGSIPSLGSTPGEEKATHSSFLAWRIPWTGELAGHSPRGHEESDRTEQLSTAPLPTYAIMPYHGIFHILQKNSSPQNMLLTETYLY